MFSIRTRILTVARNVKLWIEVLVGGVTVVSLTDILYPPFSTGSNQEDMKPSRHDWFFCLERKALKQTLKCSSRSYSHKKIKWLLLSCNQEWQWRNILLSSV